MIELKKQHKKQLEMTVEFPLSENPTKINFDMYWFFSGHMGVSEKTISENTFHSYFDIKNRIHTPTNLFPEGRQILLPKSKAHLKSKNKVTPKASGELRTEVKLFACYADNRLKNIGNYLKNLSPKSKNNVSKKIINYIEYINQSLSSYRKNYLPQYRGHSDKKLRKAYINVDEFISNRIKIIFLDSILHNKHIKEDFKDLHDVLIKTVVNENNYLEKENYLVYSDNLDEEAKEDYVVLMRDLKESIFKVLYLDKENLKTELNIVSNMVDSVGAIFSGTWWFIIWILSIQNEFFKDHAYIKEIYASLSLLFILNVLAYAIKDRIKEVTKRFLRKKFSNYIPQYSHELTFPLLDHKKIGISNEFIRYQDIDEIPRDIAYRRKCIQKRNPFIEEVMYVGKKIKLNDIKSCHPVNSIKEVVRINIEDILSRIDENTKSFPIITDDNKTIIRSKAPRTYSFYIVVKYHHQQRGVQEYKNYRIVVNKDGIIKIENIKIKKRRSSIKNINWREMK